MVYHFPAPQRQVLDLHFSLTTQPAVQTDLEAVEAHIPAEFARLCAEGVDTIFAASYAMLHLLAARRLQRVRRSKNMSIEWTRRGAGAPGCSGLPQCSNCQSRDPIGKAVLPLLHVHWVCLPCHGGYAWIKKMPDLTQCSSCQSSDPISKAVRATPGQTLLQCAPSYDRFSSQSHYQTDAPVEVDALPACFSLVSSWVEISKCCNSLLSQISTMLMQCTHPDHLVAAAWFSATAARLMSP